MIAKYLLTKEPQLINMQNEDGETSLFLASVAEHAEMVDLLLTFGADVTIKNNEGEAAVF